MLAASLLLGGSVAANAVTDGQGPTKPLRLTSPEVSAASVTLEWAESGGADHYEVYRDGVPVGITWETALTDYGLMPNTAYTYTVRAFDEAGDGSPLSGDFDAVTPPAPKDGQAPSAPSGVKLSNVTERVATLEWTASTDNLGVNRYEVYRDGKMVGLTDSTMYFDAGLSAATKYAYTIKAFDLAGNASASSEQLLVTTDAITPAGQDLSRGVISQQDLEYAVVGGESGSVIVGCSTKPDNMFAYPSGFLGQVEISWTFDAKTQNYYASINRYYISKNLAQEGGNKANINLTNRNNHGSSYKTKSPDSMRQTGSWLEYSATTPGVKVPDALIAADRHGYTEVEFVFDRSWMEGPDPKCTANVRWVSGYGPEEWQGWKP